MSNAGLLYGVYYVKGDGFLALSAQSQLQRLSPSYNDNCPICVHACIFWLWEDGGRVDEEGDVRRRGGI